MRKQLDSIYGHQSARCGRFSALAPIGVLAPVVLALIAGTAFVPPYLRSQAVASGSVSYYVSPSGNDSNPGTQSQPFATISKAARVATPGTTVHLAPGTYNSSSTIAIYPSGTSTSPITFISDVSYAAKIVSNDLSLVVDLEGSYIIFQGFDITDTSSTTYAGVRIAGSYNRVIGNYIHDIGTTNPSCPVGDGGIYDAYQQGGHDNDQIGNIIARIGPSGCTYIHGIYHANQGGHIVNNIIYGVSGYGIHCWHACTGVTIANNTIFNNGAGGHGDGIIYGAGDAPGGVVCDNMVVTNNIVYNNGRYGIREYAYPGQENMIGSHNLIANNDSHGNVLGDFRTIYTTPTNNILSNPQFVNYQADGSGNYYLQPTSPAIGAGTSTGAPSTDFDGNTIPQGNGYDIGAYQYVVAATVTPTSTPIPLPIATSMPTLLPTNTPTPTLIPTPTPILNLIQNGSFENTSSNWLAPWGFQSNGIATISHASHAKVDGVYSAKVNIAKSSSADSAVQLYQGNIPLTQGKSYTIIFWAKASIPRTIRPAILHGASPWTSYFSQSVSLTTSWQQYTLTFTAPKTDTNSMLVFNMANAAGYVWIDNVSLR